MDFMITHAVSVEILAEEISKFTAPQMADLGDLLIDAIAQNNPDAAEAFFESVRDATRDRGLASLDRDLSKAGGE